MLSTSAINTLAQSKEENLDEAKSIVTKLLKNDPSSLDRINKMIKGIYGNGKGKIFVYKQKRINGYSLFIREHHWFGGNITKLWISISDDEQKQWKFKAEKINEENKNKLINSRKVFSSKIPVKELNISLSLPTESKDISKTEYIQKMETLVHDNCQLSVISLSQVICSYLDNSLDIGLYFESDKLYYTDVCKVVYKFDSKTMETKSINRVSITDDRLVIKLPKKTIKNICKSLIIKKDKKTKKNIK